MKISRLELLEWTLLVAGTVLAVVPSQRDYIPQLAILVLLLAFAMRVNRTENILPHTGLEYPWLLFLASAAVGMWISIYPLLALQQFSRLAAAFVLYCSLVEAGYRIKRLAAWALVIGGGGLALYWPLTHEFASDPGKLPPLRAIGLLINRLLPDVPGLGFSANVVGGFLVVVLPFAIAQVWIARRHGRRRQALLAVLMGLATLGGLLLTSSRGALMGLAAAGSMFILVRVQLRRQPENPGKTRFWLVVVGVLVLAVFLLAATGLLERLVGSVPDPNGSLQSRMQIWRQGWNLIGDYVFTGAGLHSFPLVFSIYRLLIHVPYHEHMHNIFLETWYEQGVFGLIAMLWGVGVIGMWAWRGLSIQADLPKKASRSLRALGWAGMAGLVAAGVHGMVDVIFYTKRTMPILGLVLGFAYLVSYAPGAQKAKASIRTGLQRRTVVGIGVGVLLLMMVFGRGMISAGYANYGALLQTRTEMQYYNPDFYDEPSLDQIRRQQDLSQAEAALQQALVYNPANRTALQRLSEVALARGEFDAAMRLLESARSAGLEDEVTRLLYGDALAAMGRPQDAAESVRGIDWAGGRLSFQGWYRYWQHDDFQRASSAWQAVLLLNPQDSETKYWLTEAQARQGAQ